MSQDFLVRLNVCLGSPAACQQFIICRAASGCGRFGAGFEVFTKHPRCNWNLTLHKGGRFIPLLLSFQLSFFLWTTLSLFLLFLSAFIFASPIAHIRFSVIENAFSALRYSCLGRVLRGPFRTKSRQRRCVAECLPWVYSVEKLCFSGSPNFSRNF